MFEPVTANYVPKGDDWTVQVSAGGKTATATAHGLIAARDQADQLAVKLAGDDKRTVVHLLEGDALAFTRAYLTARLAKPAAAATPPAAAEKPTAEVKKPVRPVVVRRQGA